MHVYTHTHTQAPKCAVESGGNPEQLKPGRVCLFIVVTLPVFISNSLRARRRWWRCASPCSAGPPSLLSVCRGALPL